MQDKTAESGKPNEGGVSNRITSKLDSSLIILIQRFMRAEPVIRHTLSDSYY